MLRVVRGLCESAAARPNEARKRLDPKTERVKIETLREPANAPCGGSAPDDADGPWPSSAGSEQVLDVA